MTKIILNETHQLMEDQERVLNERFGEHWEIVPVPKSGWTIEEMNEVVLGWQEEDNEGKLDRIIFASPVPALILYASRALSDGRVHVLHNDHREKKELPNGKIIMTVAKTGWQLV